jgi:hypothetical protein
VPSSISATDGAGEEGEGRAVFGGTGGGSEGPAWGVAAVGAPGGTGGFWDGDAEAPTVQVPSAHTHPELPWTQWPPTQMALGEGGISQ